ncbi:MAG: hypothetical protein L6R38_007662 [Xanthoria sp. 2 TBL-2021]|nr:MAG: hypothetical protein L6R38_007662 [Xanthoria sp. 2 TBL-2021]
MSFKVIPCSPSNLHTCCSIYWQATASNPLLSLIYPNGGTENLQRNITYHNLREHDGPNVQMFCVVDTSLQDKLIAYAKWTVVNGQPATDGETIPLPAASPDSGVRRNARNQNPSGIPSMSGSEIPPGAPSSSSTPPRVPKEDTNDQFFKHFLTLVTPLRSAHLTQQTLVLDDLSVLPEHQRQGAGKLLLRTLIDFADSRNLPCYIESTPVAYDMYIHQGFREVDKLEIDLGQWRQGCNVYRTSLLYRDARGDSKK